MGSVSVHCQDQSGNPVAGVSVALYQQLFEGFMKVDGQSSDARGDTALTPQCLTTFPFCNCNFADHFQLVGTYVNQTKTIDGILDFFCNAPGQTLVFNIPPPPPQVRYNCVSGTCVQDVNGQYSDLVTCQAACGGPPPPNGGGWVGIVALIIIGGGAIYLLSRKRGRS